MAMNNIRVKNFISEEWSEYADYDNRRSIPHLMDGLKITQRKAMYTATTLPKNDKPLRVSQFASKISEKTVYHHGEASIMTTVINLAQDYMGSNNYPLLDKQGQFGSRLDSASSAPRYIHTKLHNNWNIFFNEEDQKIVKYLYDDGDQIEPSYFIPVIPMILVNGSEGMGNGFRTKILSYSVKDISKCVSEYVEKGEIKTKLVPFVNGFKGTISKENRQVTFTGVIKRVNSYKLHITELPPSYDNEKYKKILNALVDNKTIKDYENHSTEDKWDWVIKCGSDLSSKTVEELEEIFSLKYKVTENIVCWGMDGVRPITFESPEALIMAWVDERLKLCEEVIKYKKDDVTERIISADLKIKFLEWCMKNNIKDMTKKELVESVMSDIKRMTKELADKFVSMPIYKITKDEVEKEEDEIQKLLEELDIIEEMTPDKLIIDRMKSVKGI